MRDNNNLPPRVGYKQAASYIGIPVGTLRALVSRKAIPHIRIGPRSVVFDVRDLNSWMDSCRCGTSASR